MSSTYPHPARLRRIVGALAVSGSLAIAAAGVIAPAHAAAGSPGVPASPTTLFVEDFEHGLSDGAGVKLTDYTGGDYTASTYWLNAAEGDGLIVDGTTPDAVMQSLGFSHATDGASAGGTVGGRLRALANAIGGINGSSPTTANHAVTAWSRDGSANNTLEFSTAAPLTLPVDGRFLTLTANLSATSCNAAKPRIDFYLSNGTTETKVNQSTLSPCPSSGASNSALFTQKLTGDKSTLFSGSTVSILMRNQETSSSGNDHAYDDITILDVTPQLDKSFDAPVIEPGGVSLLTFTVTNTSDLLAKEGWGIDETLPAGLTLASPTVGGTCGATTTGNAAGSSNLTITNGSLAAGSSSCTITVQVTAAQAGTYTSNPSDSVLTGLDAPAAATLDVVPAVGTPMINPAVALYSGASGIAVIGGLLWFRRRKVRTI